MAAADINEFDPFVAPLPFNETLYENGKNGKVRIGYFDSLEWFPTTDAVKRSIHIAKKILEDKGFEVVPFTITNEEVLKMVDVYGGITVNAALGGVINQLYNNYEKPMKIYFLLMTLYSRGSTLRNLIRFVLKMTGN